MSAVERSDPYEAYNFEIVIPGVSESPREAKGSFCEVSGLGVEVAVIEYRNGSEDSTVRKLPGLKKYSNIVLKRGIIADLEFWNWVLESLRGQPRRVNGHINLLDEERNEVMRFNFRRGWPCKWEGPSLNAKTNEIAMETLEICHEGLVVE